MKEARCITNYRVIYGDCDSMAIVYYSNYLKLFEIGRTEWLREQGITYREVESRGFFLQSHGISISHFSAPQRISSS